MKKLTEEFIVYYNSEKPHDHLNDLPPDTWASQARSLPDQTHIFREKKVLSEGPVVIIDVFNENGLKPER